MPVVWASLVDDPSGDPSLSDVEVEAERERLFGILRRLVVWRTPTTRMSWPRRKQRSTRRSLMVRRRCWIRLVVAERSRCQPTDSGLTALSGDLNPVAVLIQKAMLEIPPRFAGKAPVNPDVETKLMTWSRAQGLAADVEAYGQWMRDEAERRIGHLYPDAIGSGWRTVDADRVDLGSHSRVA